MLTPGVVAGRSRSHPVPKRPSWKYRYKGHPSAIAFLDEGLRHLVDHTTCLAGVAVDFIATTSVKAVLFARSRQNSKLGLNAAPVRAAA